MWYLTLNEFTWNLTAIAFCVFSVAALFGVVYTLKKCNPLNTDKKWQRVIMRLSLVEAVIALVVLSCPQSTAPLFDTCCAFSAAFMCNILGGFMVYLATVYATSLVKWIFAKV